MLVPVLLFAVGLVLLIKGGDWFVDGATGLARRFHIPEIIVGATVVSIGTTLPEVMVSATGALNGQGARWRMRKLLDSRKPCWLKQNKSIWSVSQ